ncbi:Tricarboxylate transport protein TctB [Serinicoccus chungangensis]|uniref:Tricarboxylate transport protein TctB n=1 Tax=Serinicoccus chungangensis TaxID=767452 RepID=A0A0W8I4Z4_9MICO|nr:tripartite tricarboxylate transporter TctB family protein [Serinicoccus chungangensis]KUG53298.1 Tricarboxylate transport protein TctB [Serinicoccus chungangensis]
MIDAAFWRGRSGLVVPGLLAAFTTYLLVGVLTMDVPEGTDFPGPRFFPLILIVLGYLLSALLVLHYLRHPEPVDTGDQDGGRWRTFTDWRAVAWCVGGFLVFALTIELLGWILAAAVLFWCVARGIGSTRPLFDASLALFVSSLVYLGFAQGLGLNLPAGILGRF